MLEGNFTSAEPLINEALELGERAQRWNAGMTYRLQLFLLREAQGRLAEVAELYEAPPSAFEYRTYRIFDCVLARFYDELGRRDDARQKFEELAENDFAGVPVDEEWLATICLLAETAASLGDATRGRVLYELLLPYRERVGTSYPEINVGAVSRYLALLATSEKRWADAVRHFEHAIELNRRIGARPWLAYTQEDYARMLLARATPATPRQRVDLWTKRSQRTASWGWQALWQLSRRRWRSDGFQRPHPLEVHGDGGGSISGARETPPSSRAREQTVRHLLCDDHRIGARHGQE